MSEVSAVENFQAQSYKKNIAIAALVAAVSAVAASVIFGVIGYAVCRLKGGDLKITRMVTILSSIGSFSVVFIGFFGLGAVLVCRKKRPKEVARDIVMESENVESEDEKTKLDRLYDQLYEEIGKEFPEFNTIYRRQIPAPMVFSMVLKKNLW